MRRNKLSFYYIILLMVCQVFSGFLPVNASVNDFYFSDFTGDYYLSKADDGTSKLRVVESVTAVFPDFNQNKGICRQIPFTNQDGKNVTLLSLTRSNLKLTRNGLPENIYSIDKGGDYYEVCTGTDEYVLGAQTYVFEYEFSNVVTEFFKDGSSYQELYWDTNGNGSTQRFDSVTARLHFSEPEVYSEKSWCYVGEYGENEEGRCSISAIQDGVEFKAKDLKAFQNLTFDVEIKAGSFVVPVIPKDYTYVWLGLAALGLSLVCVGFCLRKYLKSREQTNYYKGLFVNPEYQPSKEFSLAEGHEIYLQDKKDVKVAMLLEMIVQKKIELKKIAKKKWNIIVKQDVAGEYMDLLSILNNGVRPAVGDEIEIKRRQASTKLVSLKNAMEDKILSDLKKDELVDKKYKMGGNRKRGFGNVIAMSILIVPVVILIGFFLMGMMNDYFGIGNGLGKEMMFEKEFYRGILVLIVATTMICVALIDKSEWLDEMTKKGLRAARYMDGLELYIRMAEADRMKMLQSVEGADTSAEGIVKLYEKLLPYAAIFGLEESWMEEMKEYCEVEEIEEPDYLMEGIAISEISRSLTNIASYANTATVMSSSGGSSSSGFSGGGGGGFSGGGGGGGGFSGR